MSGVASVAAEPATASIFASSSSNARPLWQIIPCPLPNDQSWSSELNKFKIITKSNGHTRLEGADIICLAVRNNKNEGLQNLVKKILNHIIRPGDIVLREGIGAHIPAIEKTSIVSPHLRAKVKEIGWDDVAEKEAYQLEVGLVNTHAGFFRRDYETWKKQIEELGSHIEKAEKILPTESGDTAKTTTHEWDSTSVLVTIGAAQESRNKCRIDAQTITKKSLASASHNINRKNSLWEVVASSEVDEGRSVREVILHSMPPLDEGFWGGFRNKKIIHIDFLDGTRTPMEIAAYYEGLYRTALISVVRIERYLLEMNKALASSEGDDFEQISSKDVPHKLPDKDVPHKLPDKDVPHKLPDEEFVHEVG